MKKLYFLVPLIFAFLFTGCASKNLIESNYNAADQLLCSVKDKLPAGSPVIMATVVNIDAIENSSTLGRAISEQIATRLVQAGMKTIEIKFRDNIYVKQNEGELALTREIGKIAQSHKAKAIVVGTYATSNASVFVNLKVIDPTTNIVMGATDYVIPLNDDMRTMLPDTTYRIIK